MVIVLRLFTGAWVGWIDGAILEGIMVGEVDVPFEVGLNVVGIAVGATEKLGDNVGLAVGVAVVK